jgi:hypothetical protein
MQLKQLYNHYEALKTKIKTQNIIIHIITNQK